MLSCFLNYAFERLFLTEYAVLSGPIAFMDMADETVPN